MRKGTVILVAALSLGACSVAAAAQGKHVIRFGGAFVSPTGNYATPIQFTADIGNSLSLAVDGTFEIEAKEAVALALGYEYRATALVGVDVNVFHANHDVDGRIQGTYWINDIANNGQLVETGPFDESEKLDDMTVTPLTAGVNFHLTPKAKVDFYLGAFAAYVTFGDLDVEGETLGFDDDFSYGVVLASTCPCATAGGSSGGRSVTWRRRPPSTIPPRVVTPWRSIRSSSRPRQASGSEPRLTSRERSEPPLHPTAV